MHVLLFISTDNFPIVSESFISILEYKASMNNFIDYHYQNEFALLLLCWTLGCWRSKKSVLSQGHYRCQNWKHWYVWLWKKSLIDRYTSFPTNLASSQNQEKGLQLKFQCSHYLLDMHYRLTVYKLMNLLLEGEIPILSSNEKEQSKTSKF